jgi:hypothetical protein
MKNLFLFIIKKYKFKIEEKEKEEIFQEIKRQ